MSAALAVGLPKKGWDKAAVWSPEHVLKVIGIQSAYVKNNYFRVKSWGVILSRLNKFNAPIRGATHVPA